jgi:hypothetical protein
MLAKLSQFDICNFYCDEKLFQLETLSTPTLWSSEISRSYTGGKLFYFLIKIHGFMANFSLEDKKVECKRFSCICSLYSIFRIYTIILKLQRERLQRNLQP